MILHPVTTKSLMTNHRIIKKHLLIFKMKNNLKILVIFFSLLFTSKVYAGIYDDWPDDAICTWLEQRPNHEGYLEENKKRDLNCFEREDFKSRDFILIEVKMRMY